MAPGVLPQGVNLRDVAGMPCAGSRVTPANVILRSAAPIFYRKTCLDYLEETRGVKAALDLRGKREIKQGAHFDCARARGSNLFPGEAGHHHVDLVDGATKRAVAKTSTLWQKLTWAFWYVLGWKEWVTVQVIKHLKMDEEGEGLRKLYGGILDEGGPEVKIALETIAGCMACGQTPVLIHCTAGKDRTGIIVALLLLLVDVPRDVIVADYALSEAALAEHPYVVATQHTQIARVLSKEILSSSPASAMEFVLDKIAGYGGVDGYFAHINVSRDTAATLRKGLGMSA